MTTTRWGELDSSRACGETVRPKNNLYVPISAYGTGILLGVENGVMASRPGVAERPVRARGVSGRHGIGSPCEDDGCAAL